MGKGRIHVSIDETLLEALRVRASKLHCHQSDVITIALQRELSLELFDRTLEGRIGGLEAEPDGEDVVAAPAAGTAEPVSAAEPVEDERAEHEPAHTVTADDRAVSWPGT